MMHDDITQAAAELRQLAAELRAGHTIGEEWPEPEVKAEYDRLRALASRLESARQERGEAVAWQRFHNGEWQSCTKVFHDNCLNLTGYGSDDCIYKVRTLYTAPDAGRVADDAELERIIDASAGEWHDDEFRITGGDLMHMLRAVSRLRCDAGLVADLERSLRIANDALRSASAEVVTQGQRIAALESQLAETNKAYRSMVDANRAASERLAESREREGRMREALEWVARTPGESAYWLNRVIAALAAEKEGE